MANKISELLGIFSDTTGKLTSVFSRGSVSQEPTPIATLVTDSTGKTVGIAGGGWCCCFTGHFPIPNAQRLKPCGIAIEPSVNHECISNGSSCDHSGGGD